MSTQQSEIPKSTSTNTSTEIIVENTGLTSKEYEELKNAISKTTKDFEETKKDFENTKTSLNKDRINIITLLGTFVSIFIFASTEIQVFKYICDFTKILSITFVIPGILLIFNLYLHYIASDWTNHEKNDKNNKESFWLRIKRCLISPLTPFGKTLLLGMFLIGLGIHFANSQQSWQCDVNTFQQQISKNINK
jgi:hypothetical protein